MPDKELEKLFVIKIGGNIIDDPYKLSSFLQTFALIKEKKILVHGGGKIATQLGDKLQIESKYSNGRRITDDKTIDLVTMVYGGLINKRIVAQLQSFQCNAIGITGADANLIPSSKRQIKEIDFGWVGDINVNDLNSNTWNLFLQNNLIPVVAPLTHDGKGHILNTNADTIASVISIALSKDYEVTLLYCFEKAGVLEDVNNPDSVIKLINRKTFDTLLEQKKVAEGMIPKIENALGAIAQGVHKIIIGGSNDMLQNISATPSGTTIFK